MRYTAVIEERISRGKRNFSAYVPDVPGCIAAAATREEVERLISEGLVLHLRGLQEDGLPIPEPGTSTITIEVQDELLEQGGSREQPSDLGKPGPVIMSGHPDQPIAPGSRNSVAQQTSWKRKKAR